MVKRVTAPERTAVAHTIQDPANGGACANARAFLRRCKLQRHFIFPTGRLTAPSDVTSEAIPLPPLHEYSPNFTGLRNRHLHPLLMTGLGWNPPAPMRLWAQTQIAAVA